MKTTVEISDPLFQQAREYCGKHGLSFRELVEGALRTTVAESAPKGKFRLRSFGFKGDGQLVTDWAALREAIYAGRGGEEPQ